MGGEEDEERRKAGEVIKDFEPQLNVAHQNAWEREVGVPGEETHVKSHHKEGKDAFSPLTGYNSIAATSGNSRIFESQTTIPGDIHSKISERDFNIDLELGSEIGGLTEEQLKNFVELHQDPTCDDTTELYIFALCILAIKSNSKSNHAELAVLHAEGWAAIAPDGSPEKARRLKILDKTIALRLSTK